MASVLQPATSPKPSLKLWQPVLPPALSPGAKRWPRKIAERLSESSRTGVVAKAARMVEKNFPEQALQARYAAQKASEVASAVKKGAKTLSTAAKAVGEVVATPFKTAGKLLYDKTAGAALASLKKIPVLKVMKANAKADLEAFGKTAFATKAKSLGKSVSKVYSDAFDIGFKFANGNTKVAAEALAAEAKIARVTPAKAQKEFNLTNEQRKVLSDLRAKPPGDLKPEKIAFEQNAALEKAGVSADTRKELFRKGYLGDSPANPEVIASATKAKDVKAADIKNKRAVTDDLNTTAKQDSYKNLEDAYGGRDKIPANVRAASDKVHNTTTFENGKVTRAKAEELSKLRDEMQATLPKQKLTTLPEKYMTPEARELKSLQSLESKGKLTAAQKQLKKDLTISVKSSERSAAKLKDLEAKESRIQIAGTKEKLTVTQEADLRKLRADREAQVTALNQRYTDLNLKVEKEGLAKLTAKERLQIEDFEYPSPKPKTPAQVAKYEKLKEKVMTNGRASLAKAEAEEFSGYEKIQASLKKQKVQALLQDMKKTGVLGVDARGASIADSDIARFVKDESPIEDYPGAFEKQLKKSKVAGKNLGNGDVQYDVIVKTPEGEPAILIDMPRTNEKAILSPDGNYHVRKLGSNETIAYPRETFEKNGKITVYNDKYGTGFEQYQKERDFRSIGQVNRNGVSDSNGNVLFDGGGGSEHNVFQSDKIEITLAGKDPKAVIRGKFEYVDSDGSIVVYKDDSLTSTLRLKPDEVKSLRVTNRSDQYEVRRLDLESVKSRTGLADLPVGKNPWQNKIKLQKNLDYQRVTQAQADFEAGFIKGAPVRPADPKDFAKDLAKDINTRGSHLSGFREITDADHYYIKLPDGDVGTIRRLPASRVAEEFRAPNIVSKNGEYIVQKTNGKLVSLKPEILEKNGKIERFERTTGQFKQVKAAQDYKEIGQVNHLGIADKSGDNLYFGKQPGQFFSNTDEVKISYLRRSPGRGMEETGIFKGIDRNGNAHFEVKREGYTRAQTIEVSAKEVKDLRLVNHGVESGTHAGYANDLKLDPPGLNAVKTGKNPWEGKGYGVEGRPPSANIMQAGDAPIDLNTATFEQLEKVPGIGPERAKKIVTMQKFGGFIDKRQLTQLTGVGSDSYDLAAPFIKIENPKALSDLPLIARRRAEEFNKRILPKFEGAVNLTPGAKAEISKLRKQIVEVEKGASTSAKTGKANAKIEQTVEELRIKQEKIKVADEAKQLLKTKTFKLNEEQANAIAEAHLVGRGELGADGIHKAGVGNYTQAQLREKAKIMRDGGVPFATKKQVAEGSVAGSRREAMQRGIAGDHTTQVADNWPPAFKSDETLKVGQHVSVPRNNRAAPTFSDAHITSSRIDAKTGRTVYDVAWTEPDGSLAQKIQPYKRADASESKRVERALH